LKKEQHFTGPQIMYIFILLFITFLILYFISHMQLLFKIVCLLWLNLFTVPYIFCIFLWKQVNMVWSKSLNFGFLIILQELPSISACSIFSLLFQIVATVDGLNPKRLLTSRLF